MICRALGAAALFIMAFSVEAHAARPHRPTGRVSCSDVRFYVAKYSASVAEMYARSRGATDAQIERARRCLGQADATVIPGERRFAAVKPHEGAGALLSRLRNRARYGSHRSPSPTAPRARAGTLPSYCS